MTDLWSERAERLTPKGSGEGTTWLVDLDTVGDMEDLSPGWRLDGVRLPDLAKYLLRTPPDEGEGLTAYGRVMTCGVCAYEWQPPQPSDAMPPARACARAGHSTATSPAKTDQAKTWRTIEKGRRVARNGSIIVEND